MDHSENSQIKLAFDFVKYTSRNIFLTGKAGTGKTTFLHNLKKSSPKRMVVVAPTGVAAINAGGVTIHSFFQLPFHPFIPSLYLSKTPGDKIRQKERSSYKMSREKVSIIRSLDLLVIDEISMVRADTLDAIDSALRQYKNRSLPFGGVQLLMIGDLQQLAPVVKDDEKELIREYYITPFFFGSRALGITDYLTIELMHIYRQKDQVFIDLLNKIRDNRVDTEVLTELNKRHIPDLDADSNGGYITLTTHNYQAKCINDSKLEKLGSKAHTFNAIIKDEFPEYSYPTPGELILKAGAQVMFVKNDLSGQKLFFNGKIGKIESFEDDIIVVRCQGDNYPIRVEMTEWQNMKYSLDDETKEIRETVIGTFTQYPLRLAWAITIHKSQGLTFDRAIIDAASAFAHGQVYVALSRCRNLESLVLSTHINHRSIIDDPVISAFIKETVNNQPDQHQLSDSKRAYMQSLLYELFDFTSINHNLNNCMRIVRENQTVILGNLKAMLEKTLVAVKTDLIEVTEKFHPHLKELLKEETDDRLQERIKKASEFFSSKLEDALKEILTGCKVETDNKALRKSVTEALKQMRKEGFVKLACLDSAKSGFEISKYLDARAKAAIDTQPTLKSAATSDGTDTGTIKYPSLFRLLKEWRNLKAREMNIPLYMVIPQKTMVLLACLTPQSLPALKLVKGMGKKKSAKYGEELLEIISTYCVQEKITPPDDSVFAKKSEKKIKTDTRKISFELFNAGKTIPEISEQRKLAVGTIESHLAHYVSKGEIPVSEFVSPETLDLITCCFEGKEDLMIGPAKAELGDLVSWSDLRFVVNYLKFLRARDR